MNDATRIFRHSTRYSIFHARQMSPSPSSRFLFSTRITTTDSNDTYVQRELSTYHKYRRHTATILTDALHSFSVCVNESMCVCVFWCMEIILRHLVNKNIRFRFGELVRLAFVLFWIGFNMCRKVLVCVWFILEWLKFECVRAYTEYIRANRLPINLV